MTLLRQKSAEGGRAALAAFGVVKTADGFKQPAIRTVGMGLKKAPDLPTMPPPSVPAPQGLDVDRTFDFTPKIGPKVAFNVGMGASNSTSGAGAQAGEPADTGRRQRSVIDRALQTNEDAYATSSMPLPGDVVSP
jgi:hypothetical protein